MYDWIQTFSGKLIFLLSPQPEEMDILDIAHALPHVCRYGGQSRDFYSVAEHSINVALHLPEALMFQGLMHDASEAYIHDIVRPIKLYLGDAYERLENKFMRAIADRFELQYPMHYMVKHADIRVMLTERRDLIQDQTLDWEVPGEPYPEPILRFTIPEARKMFARLFSMCSPNACWMS